MGKSKGFTLLEVTVAIGILIFAISALLIGFVTCNLSIQANHNLVVASSDAQFVLEEVRKVPFDEIDNYSIPQFTHLDNESITLDINDISEDIKSLNVRVSWYERQNQKNFSITTYRHRYQ